MDVQQIIAEVLDHIRGMWRFRWWVVGIAWLVAVPGWGAVYNMPDVYEASAKVSVDTNSLLPALTAGLTASEDLMDEVSLVSKALLTRPNLAEVARQTDLDLRADSPRQMESLITGLQKRVKVEGGRDQIFDISFKDTDRQKATEVVSSLLNIFVEKSLGAQGDDADMTSTAIRLEIENHEERLLKAEAELATFKTKNLGYMPNDGTDYYSRLQAALAEVAETKRQIRLLKQRRDEISRQLEGEEPVFGIMPTSTAQAEAACSKSGSIAQLQSELAALQVQYTDKHPRIVMLKETVGQLKDSCAEEREAMGGAVPLVNPETNSVDANPVYQSLRLQLSNADVELAELVEELASRNREVGRLRADVDKIALVETELKKLNRDYGVIEGRHQELLGRWETLESKKRIDPVTDKVQFNILEPPFSAANAVAPNRPLLLAAVLVLALGAGAAVSFGLNQVRPVFFNRRTVARITGIPVLGSVSMIMSPREVSVRRRKNWAWVAANLALLVAATMVIALADPISEIMRNLTGSGF